MNHPRAKCYFCGERATTSEHAPPKQMFRAVDCDSITVPSCDKHNNSKSGHDQAIVAAFLTPLRTDLYTGKIDPTVEPILARAIRVAEKSFQRTKRTAIPFKLVDLSPSEVYQPDIAYLTNKVNIREWVKQLTAAILFDGINRYNPSIDWSNTLEWSPSWFDAEGPEPRDIDFLAKRFKANENLLTEVGNLHWIPGWSSTPKPYPREIYFFDFSFPHPGSVALHHRFYQRYSWYFIVFVDDLTMNGLKRKLGI
jgi:hypothetical protein